MLKAITVINFKGESMRMELAHPEKTGMLIYNVTGIGGAEADINMSDLATGDGSLFDSARVTSRNIVLTIKLMGLPSVENSRYTMYKYFPIKKPITLIFETDRRTSRISGYVESNPTEIFSKDEYVTVSVMCADPFFKSEYGSTTSFSGVTPLFEFPYSNESTTQKLTEFGSYRRDDRAIIDYQGDVDTGMVITIHAMGEVENMTIYNVNTYESLTISTDKVSNLIGGKFSLGDDIIISTITGDKYVKVLHNGIYHNAFSAINKDADWLQLTPGMNTFAFDAESGANNAMVTFEYENAYMGV